jgi:hypothetical protein
MKTLTLALLTAVTAAVPVTADHAPRAPQYAVDVGDALLPRVESNHAIEKLYFPKLTVGISDGERRNILWYANSSAKEVY